MACGTGPALALGAFVGCSGGKAQPAPIGMASSSPSDAATEQRRLAQPYRPDASCEVIIDTPDIMASPHVEIGTEVAYNSNPPTSGPHYPVWAAFQEYDRAVDRRYYVHNMEHGAMVLLYKCATRDACPDVAAKLRAEMDLLPADPICTEIKNRVILTPDPLLDFPVAATAWGWRYRAQCVDAPTLRDFARDHYGQGPEAVCANGQFPF